MVLKIHQELSSAHVKVSRVVLVSGLLTFLFCIELAIGVRVIFSTFKKWSSRDMLEEPVSWALCLGCLFAAVASVMFVNGVSAMWEQKQLEEKSNERSPTRFVLHMLVGGVLWRYINLWCIETKEYQKTAAVLLTMIKFLFTQLFTIPMAIVHASILENLDELVFDVFTVLCISANLILTCVVFCWCSKEVEDLKKWNYETADLVPLIFQCDVPLPPPPSTISKEDSISSKTEDNEPEAKPKCSSEDLEEVFIKIFIFFQTFGFSFGRLLALGILLKLAGIYAISIMFLQLLISVIYLKFQTPILVSDTLPKWRQLFRLAFMSYILIFEWHLNRDPKFGYDFSSNVKHSILYYCVATIESVFYLITWNITVNYSNNYEFNPKSRFCRNIFIIGSIALILSLTIHILLLLWRSRKISRLVHSVRRRYETAKWRLSKHGSGRKVDTKVESNLNKTVVEISNPVPLFNAEHKLNQTNKSDLEKQNSYRDLREPVDDGVDLCFQKCELSKKHAKKHVETNSKSARFKSTTNLDDCKESSDGKQYVQKTSTAYKNSQNAVEKNDAIGEKSSSSPVRDKDLDNNRDREKSSTEKSTDNALKSRLNIISKNINEKFNKISTASHNMAGNMKEQIQKKRKKFQNFRSKSASKSPSKIEATVQTPLPETAPQVKKCAQTSSDSDISEGNAKEQTRRRRKKFKNFTSKSVNQSSPNKEDAVQSTNLEAAPCSSETSGDIEISEGFFVGDCRSYREASIRSVTPADVSADFSSGDGRLYREDRTRSVTPTDGQNDSNDIIAGDYCSFKDDCFRSAAPVGEQNESEDFFSGDCRSYREDYIRSISSEDEQNDSCLYDLEADFQAENDGMSPEEEPTHKAGGSPCPCYVCRSTGDHVFLRRRSFSAPMSEKKIVEEEPNQTIFVSSPNVFQTRSDRKRSCEEKVPSSKVIPNKFLMSLLTSEDRVEHYV